MKKNAWNEQIAQVKSILRNQFDYEVVSTPGAYDRVDLEGHLVYINSRCHPETRFYTLLHEYGHVELHVMGADYLSEVVPCYKRFHATRSTRSKSGKIATIVEEIEAWKRGRLLALSEDLYLDLEKYEKNMNDALMSYVLWASGV